MSAAAVGRVLLTALAIGLVAGAGEATGLAWSWAVLVGVGVSLAGSPPVVPRGVTSVVGAAAALVMLQLSQAAGAGAAVAAAVTVALLVVVAGLARLYDDDRVPAWALLVGAGAVLAGVQVADATALPEIAPALGGLVAGLLPMLVAEVVTQARRGATMREGDEEQGEPDDVDPGGPEATSTAAAAVDDPAREA